MPGGRQPDPLAGGRDRMHTSLEQFAAHERARCGYHCGPRRELQKGSTVAHRWRLVSDLSASAATTKGW